MSNSISVDNIKGKHLVKVPCEALVLATALLYVGFFWIGNLKLPIYWNI